MGLAAPAPVSNKKGKEKEVDGDTVEVTQNPEDASARSLRVASDKGNSTPLVLVTTHKSVEALQFSSERGGVMLKESAADDVVDESNDAAKVVETTQFSEEINVTHEYDNRITSHIVERENGGDEDYERENYSEDDDDDDRPSDQGDGEESIRKKLWTFFTT